MVFKAILLGDFHYFQEKLISQLFLTKFVNASNKGLDFVIIMKLRLSRIS